VFSLLRRWYSVGVGSWSLVFGWCRLLVAGIRLVSALGRWYSVGVDRYVLLART
jgi:hypothetical protein